MTRHVTTYLFVVAVCGLCGCKNDSPPPAPTAPIASSVAGSGSVDYSIDPASKTSIDMPAPIEHIKGDTTAAKGTLHVDLHDLTKTRGDVFIDLETFATHTFDDPDKNASQTHHAHTWLQIDDNEKDSAVRERNRWVHFAIRSIDGVSGADLSKVAPTKVGGDDVRTVMLTAHGDFELHSLSSKAPKDVGLEVRFHVPSGSPDGTKPSSIELVSEPAAPLHVTLADHDVKPRDAGGSIAQKASGLLGTKVAEEASVSVDLLAKPAS